MAEQLTWAVGNRNPSIAETITTDGTPVDLSSSTVRFKMRALRSSVLKVDQPAVIVAALLGQVRYDWAAADVDTAGQFLVWWEVTTSVKTQDMGEAVIEFRAHAVEANAYVELEEFKSTLELTGESFADQDIMNALVAASRSLEDMFGARWWTTAADEVRFYTPTSTWLVYPDDIVALTQLATDEAGGTAFATLWTLNTDFVLEPLNATLDAESWHTIRARPSGTRFFRPCDPRSVRVTGRFGWTAVPDGVKLATSIITTQLLKRVREAPYGIVSIGAEAMRISRFDADVERLMRPYNRSVPFA